MVPRDRAGIERLARVHLAPDVADRWLALLRPALELVAAGPDDAVVARLGGRPALPDDVAWPVWEGHGPLAYVGELHCARVPAGALDVTLPPDGRLLFFHYDGPVGISAIGTGRDARVVYVPEDVAAAERAVPDPAPSYRERLLTARAILTWPAYADPALRDAFGAEDDDWWEHDVTDEAFLEALYDDRQPRHQLGGYPEPIQGAPQHEAAATALGVPWGDPAVAAEARGWTLVLQVDSDGDMMWGDAGMLYWLARSTELDGRVPEFGFTWQCS
ncbi:MAG TPA: YwqG family protein [Frankiaceae bacterium]|nr:YwqG family protein [Frankiaceae bacterium]